ncbi:MAG: HAMP domain-containing sensor histidine kinase [Rhodospirillales bacterium]
MPIAELRPYSGAVASSASQYPFGAPNLSGWAAGHAGRLLSSLIWASSAISQAKRFIGRRLRPRFIRSSLGSSGAFFFDNAPIGIWEEDYSGVKPMIDELKRQGVTDFHAYFTENPEVVERAFEAIKVIRVNPAACRIYGVESSRMLMDWTSTNEHAEIMRPFYINELARLAEGARVFHHEQPGIAHDGRPLMTWTSTLVPDDSVDDWKRIISTEEEITIRRTASAEIDRTKRRAEEAIQVKSSFLANMSHELRTPLNAIIGFSEILHGQVLGPLGDDKYIEYAADIEASGHHLLDLINDMLDMSKIESDEYPLDLSRFNPAFLMSDCEALVLTRAAQQGVQVRNRLSEANELIEADKRALKQMILNLLSNALRYSVAGDTIEIFAKCEDNVCRVSVTDSGAGIDESDIARLTDPFNAGVSDPYLAGDSSGLGLAITCALAKLHGGCVEIESVRGAGTTVSILLPMQPRLIGGTGTRRR